MQKSYGHQLHFDSVDFRWDQSQSPLKNLTLSDLIKLSKHSHCLPINQATLSDKPEIGALFNNKHK